MSVSLAPPPRRVSWPVKIGLVFGMGQTQPAGIFFLVTLMIVWFLALRPVQQDLQFSGPTQKVSGTLSYVGKVSSHQATSNFNRGRSVPVYACHFNFEHQGRSVSAVSYLSASQPPLAGLKQVPVEFVPGKPEVARINLPGYRVTQLNGWLFFSTWFAWPVLLLPLLGLALWGFGLIRGLKLLQLLKHAKLTEGQLIRQEDTGINLVRNGVRQPITRLIFTYQVAGKLHEIQLQTSEPEALIDNPREKILYLPARPEQARLLDSLPNWLLIRDGSFDSSRPLSCLANGILPLLLLAACGVMLTQ